MTAKEKILNVPNLISFYRLGSFPLVMWLAFTGNERLFTILFSINLVSDILDGLIARLFKQATRFGARLDSLADMSTYVTAGYGIHAFKWPELAPHSLLLFTAIGFYLLTYAVSFARFHKFPSLHLYSCKIAAYLQGFFFFMLFVSGFHAWLFYLSLLWGIASWSEEVAVLLIRKELKSDARGLYWVLRDPQ
jgi:cardiolipin synthase